MEGPHVKLCATFQILRLIYCRDPPNILVLSFYLSGIDEMPHFLFLFERRLVHRFLPI